MRHREKRCWSVRGAQNCVDKANEVDKLQIDYANRPNELMEKARNDGGLKPCRAEWMVYPSGITTFTEKYAAAKTDAEKEQLVADLKKLDSDQQKQALSTGISIADQKTELEKLKQLAASPDCTDQCRELPNYSISQLEPVVNNTQLHKDNLTKAVLASTIIALTLDQPAKSGEKTPAAGESSTSKPTSAIDDIVSQ